jgi:DNA polymerase-3 subunit chi
MAEISFYHLSVSPIEKALPRLLEKVVSSGARAVLMAESELLVEKYNEILWTYSSRTFLAHGSKKDGFSSEQPIYLTAANENPNGANFLVITGKAEYEQIDEFTRVLLIFDGSDEVELKTARTRYIEYKKAGHNLTYWKQSEDGVWVRGD